MADETLTVTIEKLVQGGRGLAHHGSQVVFVRGAIPAETVTVIGGAQHKGFQEATVSDVLVASPDRIAPPCPIYEVCGGCQLQHLRYEAQLLHKAEMLQETLTRIGKVTVEAIPGVVPSPSPYGYRNSVRFAVFRENKTFRLGFYCQGTTQPVAAARCLLVPPALQDTVRAVDERLGDQPRLPVRVDSIEFKHSLAFGSTLLIYRTGPGAAEALQGLFEVARSVPSIVGQIAMATHAQQSPTQRRPRWQRWVEGQNWIADRLNDLIFRISDRSFSQANWALNEVLSRTLTDWVGSPSTIGPHGHRVLELYSGIGTLGLPLARQGALVTEVEANPYALADARHAAKVNHIGRTRFRPLRAEAMLDAVQPGEYDVVAVDPPRTGLSPECVHSLVRIQAGRLLYLSCDTPTLARDLYRLCTGGYRIARIQPFDMFPQTAHLETLVELVR
jgi:23S rRNA (uracil1939-C5)-methyltransferase